MAKLTKKLLLSYFIIFMMMAGLGFAAIKSLSTVNQNGINMYNERIIPLSEMAELARNTENIRVQMVTAMNVKDVGPTKIAEENITKVKESIKKYEQTNISGKEREKFEEFKTNQFAFIDRVNKNISLIRNGQYEEAMEGIKKGSIPYTAASQNLQELILINKEASLALIDNNQENFDRSIMGLIIVLCLGFGFIIVIGIIEVLHIVQPVKKISARADLIAKGDLTGTTVIVKNKDEIGHMATSFNQMNANLQRLVLSVCKSSDELLAVSEEMAASSEQVNASAIEVALSMNQVSEYTDKGNGALQDVSEVLIALSSHIQSAKEKVTIAYESSQTTYRTANNGKEIVNESINKMEMIRNRTIETEELINKLYQYSIEIGNITNMITNIADQTNLLALNASIEAARAGEHGHGFAVVANEVRHLAEQSNEGAGQVAELVKKIAESTDMVVKAIHLNKTEVDQGVAIVSSAGNALDKILLDVSTTSSVVNSITEVADQEIASSKKILSLMQSLSSVMENTTGNTEEVAASMQETTAAMETVSSIAENVSNMALELKTTIQQFKI